MGLDMYFSKKVYVKQWSHKKPEDQFEISITKGGNTYPNIKSERVSYVIEELMYWRKANQIHGWFCNNTEEIQPDVKYYVTKSNLQILLKTCKTVLKLIEESPKVTKQVIGGWKEGEEYMVDIQVYKNDAIQELLPPREGFFFGSYNIDDYYKEDIVNTITFLEAEIPNCEEFDEFEYYASW
jgi:hypothetical protein